MNFLKKIIFHEYKNRFIESVGVTFTVIVVVLWVLIVDPTKELVIANWYFIKKHFLKILLYFFMYILPLLLIVYVYHLNEKSKCSSVIFMHQLIAANKTNYRLNETREFSIQGISKFKFITRGENRFEVIYLEEKTGRKK